MNAPQRQRVIGVDPGRTKCGLAVAFEDGERVREPGMLETFELNQEQADALILNARIAAGWIEAPPEPEPVEANGDADELSSVFPDRG